MSFMSDNASGVAPEILDALARAGAGQQRAFGEDDVTLGLGALFSAFFEKEVAVHPVITGTAANALGLACIVRPYGVIYCHHEAHIYRDECGAPEFFSGGARLEPLGGENGKLDPAALEAAIARPGTGIHTMPAQAVSISQATECGTVYSPGEVSRLAGIAREHGLALHMDGARFANAVVYLGCGPADLTWRAGVDVMSFGASKNGAMAAEAVVFFDPEKAVEFERYRKRAGHLVSKMRFVSVQLEAYLRDDLWRKSACRANEMAALLAEGFCAIDGVSLWTPVEANQVFVTLPDAAVKALNDAGIRFYEWPADKPVWRFVASFNTTRQEVERAVGVAAGAVAACRPGTQG